MARSRIQVLHFLVCPRITVTAAGPENPYTLHDVNYRLDVAPDREFPLVEPELWIYARLFNGRGRADFAVRMSWVDGPNGEEETAMYALPPLHFSAPAVVINRAWKLAYVRFPGPGRFAFGLSWGLRTRILARDTIELRQKP
jgi:hypothetical protein